MTHLIYMRAAESVMKGVPWLHEPRSAFNVGDWPLLKQTQQAAVSLSLYPPVLSKRYFYFFFICLISTKRFVCTHSYIILHYILLRQTGRWAIFALSRREAVAVASRTCILHKPAQDDHFLRRVKTDSSAAQRLSLDRNEERYMREDYIIYTSRQWG